MAPRVGVLSLWIVLHRTPEGLFLWGNVMEIITRKDAKELGLKRYFTGKPCPHGHIGERHVIGSGCIECGRKWRKSHPQTIKKLNQMYYEKNKQELNSNRQQWYRENRKKALEYARQYRLKNSIRIKELAEQWYQKNKEKVKEYQYLQNKQYPAKRKAIKAQRRARLLNAEGSHTAKDITWLLEKQNHRCVYCPADLREGYHVDHIQPLSKGGSNYKDNLQILCPTCNKRKHAKDPIEFAQSIGLLL